MRFMRATTSPSFLDYVDLLGRGSTEDWKVLYAEAKRNPRVRSTIEEALAFVDPEIGEARALWRILLDSMPPVALISTSDEGEERPHQPSQLQDRIRRIAG